MASQISQETPTLRSMLPVISASTLGTAIEWYDFFLYTFFSATIFAKLFFPTLDPFAGTIAAFTTNFVGLAARRSEGLSLAGLGTALDGNQRW